MKILLLSLLIITFISCGNKYDLGTPQSISLESRNLFFKEDYGPETQELRHSAIFRFNNDLMRTKQNDYSLFLEKEMKYFNFSNIDNEKISSKAQVIVLYSNHFEIYYVDRGLVINDLQKILNLEEEKEKKIYPLESGYSRTAEGKTFYLVSVSAEDLMRVDRNNFHFEKKLDLKEEIKIYKGQRVELEVFGHLYKNRTKWVQKERRAHIRCNRILQESGDCGPCTYLEELAVNDLEFLGPASDNYIQINYQSQKERTLEIEKNVQLEDGTLYIMKIADSTNFFSVDEIAYNKIKKATQTRDQTFNCGAFKEDRELILDIHGQVEMKLVVRGRGELLRQSLLKQHP